MRPVDRGTERRHLVHRADQKLEPLVEAAHLVEECLVPVDRLGELRGGDARSRFDFPDGCRLELVGVTGEKRRERLPRSRRADRQEEIVDAAVIAACLFDAAPETPERASRPIEPATNTPASIAAAAPPLDPPALFVTS